MAALNVGINSTFEQQRLVINTLAIDVNSMLTGLAGVSTYSLVSGVSTNALNLGGQSPSYYLNYPNFTNKPTKLSDFTNDVGFITAFSISSGVTVAGVVTANQFVGNLTGTATTATKVSVSNATASGNLNVPLLGSTYTGAGGYNLHVDDGALLFNPFTNTLSAPNILANSFTGSFSGTLTGNVTGNVSGTSSGLVGTPNINVSNITSNNITSSGRIVGSATTNIIPFLYSTLSDLPDPSTYHGAFAHVHDQGKAYYAHSSKWRELVNFDYSLVDGSKASVSIGTATFTTGNLVSSGIITAVSYRGDGSQLTGIVASGSGLRVEEDGVLVGAATTVNFVGTAVTASLVNNIIRVEITDTDTIHWNKSVSGLSTSGNVAIGGTGAPSGTSVLEVRTSSPSIRGILNNGGYFGIGDISVDSSRNIGIGTLLLRGSTETLEAPNAIISNLDVGFTTSYGLDITSESTFRGDVTIIEDLRLKDGKYLQIGDGFDLSMHHDGLNSYILDQGTGSLILGGSSTLIKNAVNTKVSAEFVGGSYAKLFYDNVEKFSTIGSGATTYGRHYATAFYGDGSNLTGVIAASSSGISIQDDGTPVGTATTLNFTGTGVFPTYSNGVVTLDVTAALGSAGKFQDGTTGIHTTASAVGLGTTNPKTQLQLGDVYGIEVYKGSLSVNSGVTTDGIGGWTIADTDFVNVEYKLYFNYNGSIQTQKALVMHNGTTAFVSEYAMMMTGDTIMNIDAIVSNGNVIPRWTPNSGVTGIVTYRVVRESML